ncbi:MAG: winged helix-turn-helix transcriptional regulator [Rhodospirillaceae bacterium]|nr:winged helix-turn-helix transcriptional regulator [Rhodospirillaceae bacterium]
MSPAILRQRGSMQGVTRALPDDPTPVRFSVTDFPTYYIYTIQSGNLAALNHALRPFGIPVMFWRVLAVLQESDGHNISYLSGKLAIDRSNLSRIVDQMARDGLVERRTPAHDRRNVLVCITAAGRRKVAEAFPAVLRIVESTLDGFSAQERRTLLALLKRMRNNVLQQGGR